LTGSAGPKDNRRLGSRGPAVGGSTPSVFRVVLAGSDDGLWVWRTGTPRSGAAPGRAAAQAGGGRGCPGRRPGCEKQAETAFDAASDRFAAAEQALYMARGERARARQQRYAARQAHEQAEVTARRLRRRVDELSGQLARME
jgi:hypothetical protein